MPESHPLTRTDLHAHIVSFSDRIISGEKTDQPAQWCKQACLDHGFATVTTTVSPESADDLNIAIAKAITDGARLLLILGGSGLNQKNCAPEVARTFIEVEIPGIAEQIRAYGLQSTPLACLSRSVVGLSARNQNGCLIVVSPGSLSGVTDTMTVLLPLLSAIYRQLDEY